MTDNEGASTDCEEEETPAEYTIRGAAGLLTASCLRQYPRDLKDRKLLGMTIPDDFSKEKLVENFRKLINVKTNMETINDLISKLDMSEKQVIELKQEVMTQKRLLNV